MSCRHCSRTRTNCVSYAPDTPKALLEGLAEKDFGPEQLKEMAKVISAERSDVLAYVAFTLPPITRSERVTSRKPQILSASDDKLQAFLEFVLGQYVQEGVGELDNEKSADAVGT